MSRILLIDDEPATRLVTQNRLKDLGFEVVAVDNGAMGLHEARETAFDLVVVDVGLGAGGGGVGAFDVCKRLKQTPQTAGIPVVMTSKQASGVEEMRRGFEAGCEAFLPKANQAVLDEVVRAMLRIRAHHEDLARQIRALEEANRKLQDASQADAGKGRGGAADAALSAPTASRPDGLLLVDGEGVVRFHDRGARDLLGGGLVGKNLGRVAPASGLEAFVRDARTESRDGFRFDLRERNGRTSRSLTAAVVPLVAEQGAREVGMRVVLLVDASRHKGASERQQMREYTIPRREVGVLLEAARSTFSPATLIGTSAEMQRVRSQVVEAARTRHPALIAGPCDSGKQHAARAIHFDGETDGPFHPVNCAALVDDNLESELFGQTKSAEGGERPGVFQLAHHGTVYLENVDALSPELQERLEETLRTGKVRRTGAKRQEKVDVRVVASSEVDLRALVGEGAFRPGLLDLLVTHEIHVPALSERRGDVLPLARHFLVRFGAGRLLELTPEAERQLEGYDWPGNVRELCTCIERACHATDGEVVDVAHLPAPLGDADGLATHEMVPRAPAQASEPGTASAPQTSAVAGTSRRPWEAEMNEQPVSLELYEKMALLRALHETGGDKLAAARLLKVGKSTLYRKLKRYDIQ